MTTIGDFVKIDEHAQFRNDVQLAHYDDPDLNLGLVNSYIFTFVAPGESEPSIGIIEKVLTALSNPIHENRMVAIANYGHGKSHLALVLANYFGKDFTSPELRAILEKIEHNANQPAIAQRYKTYRQNNAPCLIVRLRGDMQRNLREQFMQALEQALNEHSQTQNIQLPFWYSKAASWLQGLEGETLKKANQYLSQFSTDVSLLKQDVAEKSDDSYDLCRNLFRHLHGVSQISKEKSAFNLR